MLSLASMTGTGDLIGGDTLAGGGAAKAGDRGLLLGDVSARRGAGLRGVTASVDLRSEAPASHTCLDEEGDILIIIAGILSVSHRN